MKRKLRVLTLNVTESCDAACRYCHCWRVNAPDPEPLDALVAAIDETASLGTVAVRISGGEPLLRPDLPALVTKIREHDMVSMVCTSANGDRRDLSALLDAGLDLLSVSVDTLEPEAFRDIRGYALAPVMQTLEALSAQREKLEFDIVLSVVISRPALNGLPRLLEYAQRLDLLLSFTPFQGGSAGRRSPMTSLAFRDQDEDALRAAMEQVRQAAQAGARVVNSDAYLSGIADFLLRHRLPAGHVCRASDEAAIRPAGGGELKLCHSMQAIPAATLADAWTGPKAELLRTRMAQLDCPGCWLSCHADERRPLVHRFGRPQLTRLL